MDRGRELSEFLRTRRERLQPEDVGLPRTGRRRAAGLRRSEVAQLSGVSVDYYVRIEQGRGRNPSPEVLTAIGRALRLDEHELRHLLTLADAPVPAPRGRQRTEERVRPGVQRLLEALSQTTPALVLGHRMDVLAFNPLAAALLKDVGALVPGRRNMLRTVFLDPRSRTFYREWDRIARESIARLRVICGAYPDDPQLAALVGELAVKSEEFRQLWSRYDVSGKLFGRKEFQHSDVGPLTLDFEALTLPDGADQQLVTYTAEPGSDSAQGLRLLAVVAAELVVDVREERGEREEREVAGG
ncbi:helix-turn-helix transcriptional regulator [Streptomyces sp. L2]|uniref:helix-turn-helix transcriptional regulator n=1 Tax=Streptomyces sp. L2 TaxID=2162665 RepID=UPI001010A1FF|nr:helix-turn-helix transcriptional regulator [Streptomyces sp. L2]